MIKLAKYLRPFAFMLLAVVGLLFLQAFSDLNLPNYMSDIVNTGIQQGGVENAAPSALSFDGMRLVTAVMADGEKGLVERSYTLAKRGDAAYATEHPGAADTDVYVKNQVDDATDRQLNDAFSMAAWTLIDLARAAAPQESDGAAAPGADDADLDRVYAALPVLERLPRQAVEDARQRAALTDESIRRQAGAALARAFYGELGVDAAKTQNDYILSTGGRMLLIALAGAAASIMVGLFSSKIAAGMAKNIRRDVFAKVEDFSLNEFNKFSTASLITRTTNDITQIQTFAVMAVRMLLYAPVMGVGGVIMALSKSASMAWVIGLAVLVMAGLMIVVFAVALPKFKTMQKLVDKLNLVSREGLSGMPVIRAFGTQKHEEKRFDAANGDLAGATYFISKVMVSMMPVMMFVMNCVSLLIVWVGARQIEQSALQVGDMMAYIQYAMMIIMAFLMIAMMFIMAPRASVSAGRISEVLETTITVSDPQDPRPFDQSQKGVVEFCGVDFQYEGAEENVLYDVTFTARPGEVTAFIGSTGAGKSTLVNLIPRFYDVSRGRVLVNGVDVRDVKQRDLRAQIGYVPQKGALFSGTIASNLRYGARGASDEQIMRAAEIAQAAEFIGEREGGLESPVSEGGSNVSGGQKQRLAIARALATGAPIYIFDDSFSALDFKTDAALRKALRPYARESAVLIVAQRVSTILHADQIIVLDDGRIVGKGTHEELMRACPTYREIAQSQAGGREA